MTKSTDDFLALNQNPGVKYEEGAQNYAQVISQNLAPAIQAVENKQGAFKEPAVVFVANTIDSFGSYCASTYPSACVVRDKLFISPKLMKHPQRIPAVLTHELSHLQFTQEIGIWNYQSKVPVWFKEGLAVYISNSGGAENVTEQQAAQAIKQGKIMEPNGSGALLFRKTASSFGLKTHMFYRQSAMYVEWFHDVNPGKFRKIFTLLEQGKTLNEAVTLIYGFSVHQGWKAFIGVVKHNNRINTRRLDSASPSVRKCAALTT